MPGVYDYNSVNDAWQNGSVMDMVNNQVAQPTQPAPQPAPQSTEGIVQPSVQNLQQPNNSVFNQTHRAETPQPVPTQPTTQIATQGMGRRPTLQDYQAFALDYLAKKGYDYDEAMELMRPEFQAFAVREQAQNQALADDLVGRMQSMDIASPEYRQAAFQLYRLDPKMGQFMLKERIGPRELYTYNRNRQDRIADREATNKAQLNNMLQRAQVQQMIKQQQQENQVQQLMQYGGLDERTARMAVYGVRNGRVGATADNGGVSEKDYKLVTGRLKELLTKQDEGMQTNPNYRLSAEEQDEFNRLSQIANLAKQQLYAKYNVGGQQRQVQPRKVNFNDYYSLKPAIDHLVERNGGKIDKNIAQFVREKAGIGKDNTNPEEFINQILLKTYGFSG